MTTRSASGMRSAAAAAPGAGGRERGLSPDPPSSGTPHSWQKRAEGPLTPPQARHDRAETPRSAPCGCAAGNPAGGGASLAVAAPPAGAVMGATDPAPAGGGVYARPPAAAGGLGASWGTFGAWLAAVARCAPGRLA